MEILLLSEPHKNEDRHAEKLAESAVKRGHSLKRLPLKGYAVVPHNGHFRAVYKGQEYHGDVVVPRVKSAD